MSEVPDQSIETLRQLPVQVTWTNEGYSGTIFGGGGLRKVYGEFFSMDLQGQSDDDLYEYEGYFESPASFSGAIEFDESGDKYLSAGTLSVNQDVRRSGLGERLSRAMACIAVEQNCQYIDVSFSHPAALKIFRNIFGDERIHYLPKDVYGEELIINNFDEAKAAIDEERQNVMKYGVQRPSSGGILRHQPEKDEDILPGAVEGVKARVDVTGFDISDFDKPIQTGILPGSEPEEEWDL